MYRKKVQWTVTRQHPHGLNSGLGDDEDPVNVVEVAQGDINYAGSDMLNTKYARLGEGDTFDTCYEAVEAAIKIRDRWNAEDPDAKAEVGIGNTRGMGLEIGPFDGDDDDLRAKAQRLDEQNAPDEAEEPFGEGDEPEVEEELDDFEDDDDELDDDSDVDLELRNRY